jgi:hypothetical protein
VLFFSLPNDLTTPADDGPPPALVTCSNPVPMILNADRVQWTGTIFNPCGTVVVNAADTVSGTEHLRGTIIGLRVRINGEGFRMLGTGSGGSPQSLVSLVE